MAIFTPKNPVLGCFGGVFDPILALFRPKQAFDGQNEPKTPPKPDFLVKKWPHGHPQRRRAGGEWKFFVPSAHLHTYICRWSSAVSARTHTKVGFYPPPPPVTAPYGSIHKQGRGQSAKIFWVLTCLPRHTPSLHLTSRATSGAHCAHLIYGTVTKGGGG